MAKSPRTKRRRGSSAAAAISKEADDVLIQEKNDDGNDDGSDDVVEETAAGDDAEDDALQQHLPTTASETNWNSTQSHLINNLLPFVSSIPEEMLTTLTLLLKKDDDEEVDTTNGAAVLSKKEEARQQLLMTTSHLFCYIEQLANMEDQLKEKSRLGDEEVSDGEEEKEEGEQPCTLSGLPALYTGEAMEASAVDAETIWGQVELQNDALMPRLKKLIKKLGKKTSGNEEEMVRILDTRGAMGDGDGMVNEDDSDDDDDDSGEDMSEGSAASDFEEEQNDNEEDEDENPAARRVRERMEKAMADMEDDDSGNEDKSNDDSAEEDNIINISNDKKQQLKELAIQAAALEEEDPDREEMRDGFFDLHEMEAFADEEEEMLPMKDGDVEEDEKKGKDKKGKNAKGVLPHVRDRMDGGSDSDEEEEEEDSDDEDEVTKPSKLTTVQRKKYRADDEVDALHKIYEQDNDNESDSDSDEEKGGVEMTAADLFGNPNKKLIKSYKSKPKNDKKTGGKFTDATTFGDDAFEDDGMDWKEQGDDGEEGSESEEEPMNDDDEEEDEGDIVISDNNKLSSHALQSKKLQAQTLAIEQDMFEKPWKMRGEAKSTARPVDSLVDGTPEFEVAFKPPPQLTEADTSTMEEMIKKRVIDDDWDDVVPRELPDIGITKGGDAPEVSQEKSKLGLGELYEREYLKKAVGFDRGAAIKETEEDAAKEEMKQLFANMCSQLDALSNYQFAPRPVAEEASVQNRPAIAMEEVLPLHVSQSKGVAPQEVFGGSEDARGGVLKGESELDQAERKRLRNASKAARRTARKQKHADEKLISKLQPGLGLNNPYEKRKLREELQMARASGKVTEGDLDEAAAGKEYQTSTKFFAKMQEHVDGLLHGDGDEGGAKKKRKGEAGQASSSSYRL